MAVYMMIVHNNCGFQVSGTPAVKFQHHTPLMGSMSFVQVRTPMCIYGSEIQHAAQLLEGKAKVGVLPDLTSTSFVKMSQLQSRGLVVEVNWDQHHHLCHCGLEGILMNRARAVIPKYPQPLRITSPSAGAIIHLFQRRIPRSRHFPVQMNSETLLTLDQKLAVDHLFHLLLQCGLVQLPLRYQILAPFRHRCLLGDGLLGAAIEPAILVPQMRGVWQQSPLVWEGISEYTKILACHFASAGKPIYSIKFLPAVLTCPILLFLNVGGPAIHLQPYRISLVRLCVRHVNTEVLGHVQARCGRTVSFVKHIVSTNTAHRVAKRCLFVYIRMVMSSAWPYEEKFSSKIVISIFVFQKQDQVAHPSKVPFMWIFVHCQNFLII